MRRTMLTVAQAEPERVAVARHQLRELLHDWSSPDQVDSAVLLLSEMLTNVLVHTETDALLLAEVTDGSEGRRIRVEVTDAGDDLPHLRRPGSWRRRAVDWSSSSSSPTPGASTPRPRQEHLVRALRAEERRRPRLTGAVTRREPRPGPDTPGSPSEAGHAGKPVQGWTPREPRPGRTGLPR